MTRSKSLWCITLCLILCFHGIASDNAKSPGSDIEDLEEAEDLHNSALPVLQMVRAINHNGSMESGDGNNRNERGRGQSKSASNDGNAYQPDALGIKETFLDGATLNGTFINNELVWSNLSMLKNSPKERGPTRHRRDTAAVEEAADDGKEIEFIETFMNGTMIHGILGKDHMAHLNVNESNEEMLSMFENGTMDNTKIRNRRDASEVEEQAATGDEPEVEITQSFINGTMVGEMLGKDHKVHVHEYKSDDTPSFERKPQNNRITRTRRDVPASQIKASVANDSTELEFTETFVNGTVLHGTIGTDHKVHVDESAEIKVRQRRNASNKNMNFTDTKHSARVVISPPKEYPANPIHLSGIFRKDVWKSHNIRWVAKIGMDKRIRPSDRQFFHQHLPEVMGQLSSTCVRFVERDERDFTLLKHINWKDPEPSLKYPAVPKQCDFGRSNGFLCVVVDDGSSCYYSSGWAQDRVQVIVDGRLSQCGQRRQLQMVTHALGLMHEHDRGDALKHVHLHPRLRVLAGPGDLLDYRIPQDSCDIFRQNKTDLPFDYASTVLHDNAVAPESEQMDYDLPLVPRSFRDFRQVMAYRRAGLSHFDKLKLRQLYGCGNKDCRYKRPCENFGFRTRFCKCECAPGFRGSYCHIKEKKRPDHCAQKINKPTNFHLRETACPLNNQSFNYTIKLSTKRDHRFVVTITMSPVYKLLHGMRILPDCGHARIYFTGSGVAWPRKVCADTLLKGPLKLRTQGSSAVLALVIYLPMPEIHPGALGEGLPSPQDAIGGVHFNIQIERNPASELTVDTSRPELSTTSEATNVTSSTSPSLPPTVKEVTNAVEIHQPLPPQETAESEPTPAKTEAPAKTIKQNKILEGEAPLAARSGKSSRKAEAAIIVIVVLLILATGIALGFYMWRRRRAEPEVMEPAAGEEVAGEGEGEVSDNVEYANSATQANVPPEQE